MNQKIKAGTLPVLPIDQNPYADWSAHLFFVDRAQYVLLSNTASMYSVVFFGRGITNDDKFIDHALMNLREFMQDDGQQFAYRRFVVPATGEVRFAKSLSRSVTGSMNELILNAAHRLAPGELSPFDVSFHINDVLLSAIGGGESYRTPRDAFKSLGIPAIFRQDGEVGRTEV